MLKGILLVIAAPISSFFVRAQGRVAGVAIFAFGPVFVQFGRSPDHPTVGGRLSIDGTGAQTQASLTNKFKNC